MSEMTDAMRLKVGTITDSVSSTVHEALPKLRGWIHLASAPLTLAAGIVLIVLAPAGAPRIGAAVFTMAALLLFTVSAIYHRSNAMGKLSPRSHTILKRWDHANIMLMIAGSYTPFSLLLLDGVTQVVLLSVVWTGAILGVFFRVFWPEAPRWLYVPNYIALGWAAIFWLGDFASSAGPAVLTLIIVGGGLYSVGGLVYGLKRPNPIPRWFGFHEVFHTFTILAFIVHYTGVSLATYSLR